MSALNWAGNLSYRAAALHHPRTLDEVRELVRRLPKLRVLGSRHSFNDIADTTGDQLSLDRLPRTLEVDRHEHDDGSGWWLFHRTFGSLPSGGR